MSRLPRTCCSERSSNGTCRSAPRTSSVIYAVSNKRSRLASRRNEGPPAALQGRLTGDIRCQTDCASPRARCPQASPPIASTARPPISPTVDGRTARIRTVGPALRVLVTGGAGFFGSHVVDALLARGDQVLVVDDLSTGDRANLDGRAELRVADVSDRRALERALAGERIGGGVHCAGKTKVVESMEKEELYRDVIVRGTENVVGLARPTGASLFVNTSTRRARHGATPVCAEENTPVDPPSNYGRFKAQAEQIVAGSRMPAGSRVLS